MKRNFIITILFSLILGYSFSQNKIRKENNYANKFDYHLLYSTIAFYDINNKPVSFQGISFGITSGYTFSLPFEVGISYYFNKKYDGQIILTSSFDTLYPKVKLLEAPVTANNLSLDLDFTIKNKHFSFKSKSENFIIYPQIGLSALLHTIRFNYTEISYDMLSYWCVGLQGISLGSYNFGVYSRFRINNVPICLKVSQNIVFSKKNYYKDNISRDFSSYLKIGIGITFPVNKGPGMNKTKILNYKWA